MVVCSRWCGRESPATCTLTWSTFQSTILGLMGRPQSSRLWSWSGWACGEGPRTLHTAVISVPIDRESTAEPVCSFQSVMAKQILPCSHAAQLWVLCP